MTAALERLFDYFQYVGVASVVAWVCALMLVLLYALLWRSSLVCWTGLAAAIAGIVLAQMNSDAVRQIKIDLSDELQAAEDSHARVAGDDEGKVESDLSEKARRAQRDEAEGSQPDTPPDAPPESPASESTADETEFTDAEPEYRKRGKVQRLEGKQTAEKIPIELDSEERTVADSARTMKMHEVAHANRLDRLNRLLAMVTLCLTITVVVIDYFRRFNSTFGCYLPLPLSGPLVDSLFPKSHVVRDSRHGNWKRFLERAVRKGETFILFARQDPWSRRYLRRLPFFLPWPWTLEKVTCGGQRDYDDQFILESAWFGRYGFVVLRDGPSRVGLLDSMVKFLELRRETRASARRTVNVLWTFSAEIPPSILDRLLALCPETNFRLITTA